MVQNLILDDLSIYGAEFTLRNGKPACLLIHGLCSGPILMRELGEYLYKDGHTARGILLPGHCMNMGGLSSESHYNWSEKVESEYHKLTDTYKEVVVIGFSLGALLTLQLAVKYPIKKMVLMGIPIFLVREYLPMNSLIKLCKNFTQKVRTWRRKCYMESEAYSGYLYHPVDTYYSLQAVDDILNIIETIKPRLKDIKSPALVIHSQKDGVAAPASARYVLKNLGSANKQLVWLNQSHHYMLSGGEKSIIFDAIKNFLR
ncbi:MAG: alpha/beta hydrolase [Candidatus Jettenia sp.]|nr:MAG: alpha/beta hydrolase [Candidatus Jettenia sp.]